MIRNIFLTIISLLIFASGTFAQEDEGCPQLTDKKAIKIYKEAFGYFQDKHSVLALPLFKDVIQIEPGVANSYFYLGYINFKLNENYKAAETYLLKSIELCPEFDIYAYYFLGDICAGREEWANAVKYLSEFVKDPALIDNDGDLNRAKDLLKWAKFYDNMLNHPVPFNPNYISGICTVNHEYLPCISPDGEIAFYTRVLEMPPRKDDIYQQKYFKEALFYSDLATGKFTGGQEMPYPFNATENIGSVTVTLDNNHLFVAVGKTLADGYLNVDIYDSYRDSEGYWSSLDTVPNINGRRTWETQPSISSDGKTLYFVSDRAGGFGAGDIWCSHMDSKGEWGRPENLGPSINTKGEEKTPFIHTDSQTLYFTSGDAKDGDASITGIGLPGVGGLDIFFSKHHDDGSWSKPVNLGYPINTTADESGFSVSTNGKTGYYTSNKLNGPGGYDVYAFDLYKEARPEEVSLIKGEVTQQENNKPIKARIEIKNVVTKKISEIPVDSVTGKYVAALIFKNDYILTVKSEDYAYESKYLKKEDSSYVELTKVDFEVKPIVVGNSYRLNDIYFDTKSSVLKDESRSVLDGFIIFLKENPKIKVSIQGHTDNVGKPEDNLKLSDDRAKSVYEYLLANGIDGSRLSYKGFGEGKPIATNETPEGKAKNRRTEFVIIEK